METFTAELFECEELTVPCVVPLYWNDLEVWNDDEVNTETIEVRGIQSNEYLRAAMGYAGQDSMNPRVKIQTAEIPNAREGDSVMVDGAAYVVGTPEPDGNGVTELDLKSV